MKTTDVNGLLVYNRLTDDQNDTYPKYIFRAFRLWCLM